jgi:hypothetical protein
MLITHSDFKKLSDHDQKGMINNSILRVLIFTQKLETTVNKYYENTAGPCFMDAHLLSEKISKENRNIVRLIRFYQLIQNNKKK